MPTTITRILALLMIVGAGPAFSQMQTGPDDRYKISLTVNDVAIQGSQELVVAAAGKSAAERWALQDAAVLSVKRNSSFQLVVNVTNPSGETTNYTGSRQLIYDHFGCLTVSAAGIVTVTPSGSCKAPNTPLLWVAFTDTSGKPVTYNEYLLRVTD